MVGQLIINSAPLHRLRGRLSANFLGPKKRDYKLPITLLSVESWAHGMGQPGLLGGGMACTTTSEERLRSTYENISTPPIQDEHNKLARLDKRQIVCDLRKKTPQRRACPPWGVPTESLLVALCPEESIDTQGAGLGCATDMPAVTHFHALFNLFLQKVRSTSTFPLL